MSDKEPKVMYVKYYPEKPDTSVFWEFDSLKEATSCSSESAATYKVTLSDPPIFEKVEEKKMCPKGLHDLEIFPIETAHYGKEIRKFCIECRNDFLAENIGEIKDE